MGTDGKVAEARSLSLTTIVEIKNWQCAVNKQAVCLLGWRLRILPAVSVYYEGTGFLIGWFDTSSDPNARDAEIFQKSRSHFKTLAATIQNLVARTIWYPEFVHPSPSDDLENVTIGARKVSNHAVEEGTDDGTHVFEVTLQSVFMN